jgi:hypothetical protein
MFSVDYCVEVININLRVYKRRSHCALWAVKYSRGRVLEYCKTNTFTFYSLEGEIRLLLGKEEVCAVER